MKYIWFLIRHIKFSIQFSRWGYWDSEGGSWPKSWNWTGHGQDSITANRFQRPCSQLDTLPYHILLSQSACPIPIYPVPLQILLFPTKMHSTWSILNYALSSRSPPKHCVPALWHLGLLQVSWDPNYCNNFCHPPNDKCLHILLCRSCKAKHIEMVLVHRKIHRNTIITAYKY